MSSVTDQVGVGGNLLPFSATVVALLKPVTVAWGSLINRIELTSIEVVTSVHSSLSEEVARFHEPELNGANGRSMAWLLLVLVLNWKGTSN